MRGCRRLGFTAALLLFAGLFLHVGLMSRSSALGKQLAAVEREIELLRRQASVLELMISEKHNLEQIGLRAQQLGMKLPDETQIRVLSPAEKDTSAQVAVGCGN